MQQLAYTEHLIYAPQYCLNSDTPPKCLNTDTPLTLKQSEFSLKQFAKRMGQANYSAYNKWKKVWVAGVPEKKHWSIIWGNNHLKQVQNGPVHSQTGVAYSFQTFEKRLPLNNLDNAEWTHR